MLKELHILLLEDSEEDAELVRRKLQKSFMPCTFSIVSDKQSFEHMLDTSNPDVILADNSLPQFDAFTALEMVKSKNHHMPFIMVTGTVSEEFAAEIIKKGADDYILKDRLARLPAAIETAVKKRRMDRAKEEADRELERSEKRYRSLFEDNLAGVYEATLSGKIFSCNKAMASMLGYSSPDELISNNEGLFYYSPEEKTKMYTLLRKDGQVQNHETILRHKDGHRLHVIENVSLRRVDDEDDLMIQGVMVDITERKNAENEVINMIEQLRQLSEHLQNVREEERTGIAREIHDELGQQLTIMKIDVSWLDKKLPDADESVRTKINELRSVLDQTIITVRKIAASLRPTLLDDMGLVPAIEWHLNEFQKRTGIHTRLTGNTDENNLNESVKTGLFRIFQESLTNVARHANATEAEVSVESGDDFITLTIRDNGKGFDMGAAKKKKTLGLLGMKERAFMMKGDYSITSQPGKGTETRVVVPKNNGALGGQPISD